MKKGSYKVKAGLAQMLKGGVIMDVTTAEQAKIAEDAGAVSVMALYRIPADVRASGGVARTAPVENIEKIMDAVSIPVMAKCRIGHYGEARILEEMGIDYIDESEVLTPADHNYHLNKWDFKVPVLNGCRNLGEALRRIEEGAAMIRTKGEPGTGDISQAVDHMRVMRKETSYLVGLEYVKENKRYIGKRKNQAYTETRFETLVKLVGMKELDKYHKGNGIIGMEDEMRGLFKEAKTLKMDNFDEIYAMDSKDFLELYSNRIYGIEYHLPRMKEEYGVSQDIIDDVGKNKQLPVVNFAAGGVATPADAAFMMMLGADGVFIGSGIFKSETPEKLAKAMVEAVTFWKDPEKVRKVSYNLGEPMKGIASDSLKKEQRMQDRSA